MATLSTREYFIEELRRRRAESQQQIKQLTAEQSRIAFELEQATSLLEHVEALLRVEAPGEFGPTTQRVMPDFSYDGLSVREAVEKVLREANRPLHANQIMQILQSKGFALSQKDPLATIVTVLVRGVRAGLFRRTAPNTYMLVGGLQSD